MLVNVGKNNSIFNQFISEIRNVKVQNDRMRFRRNMERIGEIFAYEISKNLEYENKDIITPLGSCEIPLMKDQPVIATILRAGLPLHTGFLNYFDQADNAFISAYRKHSKDGSFEIKLEYISTPDLTGKTLILVDPMLATGSSMVLTYKSMLAYGKPKAVHIVSAIACTDGVNYLKRNMPRGKYTLWVGAVDDELTAQSYIVPGLGDAGDLSYGSKL